MKNLFIILLAAMFLFSCSGGNKDKERFIETYKDILLVWGYYPDSASAVPKIKTTLKNHGYTEATFRNDFFKFAQNPQEFNVLRDSARVRADRILAKQRQSLRRE